MIKNTESKKIYLFLVENQTFWIKKNLNHVVLVLSLHFG